MLRKLNDQLVSEQRQPSPPHPGNSALPVGKPWGNKGTLDCFDSK